MCGIIFSSYLRYINKFFVLSGSPEPISNHTRVPSGLYQNQLRLSAMIGMSEHISTSEVMPSLGVTVYESNKHFEYNIIYIYI
jgi:hypothetical protein